mgnify:FL=1
MVTTGRPRRTQSGRILEPVPQWWLLRGGSQPEYYVYKALLRTGRKEEIDFTFQTKFFGGRISRGGSIADFIIVNPPMGINVQSRYYHARTTNQRAHDRLQREQYEANGIKIAYIDENEAFENADFYVRRALSGYTSGPIGD